MSHPLPFSQEILRRPGRYETIITYFLLNPSIKVFPLQSFRFDDGGMFFMTFVILFLASSFSYGAINTTVAVGEGFASHVSSRVKLWVTFSLVLSCAFKKEAFPAIINLRSSRNGKVSASSMTISTGVSSKSKRMTDPSSISGNAFFSRLIVESNICCSSPVNR